MLDIIIKGGSIIDGSGSAPYSADIGIKDGRIEKIGNLTEDAEAVIDAAGLTVTPGFIDSHSHSDNQIFSHPEMREKIEQGITTSIGGQCGSSLLCKKEMPKDFFEKAAETKLGSSLATFVGHGSVRAAVMNYENREPSAEELSKMKELVRESIRRGAVGMSTGLIYNPGMFAKTDELIELSSLIACQLLFSSRKKKARNTSNDKITLPK